MFTSVSDVQAADLNEETVLMQFPRKVTLTLSHSQRIRFEAGVQAVPKSLVGHWYLKANGVTALADEAEDQGHFDPSKPLTIEQILSSALQVLNGERFETTDADQIAAIDFRMKTLAHALTEIVKDSGRRKEAADRKAKHEQLRVECRAISGKVHKLTRELGAANHTLLAAEGEFNQKEFFLGTLRASRPSPETYPTDKEIAEWVQQVSTAEAELEKKRGPRDAARVAMNGLKTEKTSAEQELARLSMLEKRLGDQVALDAQGKPAAA